MHKIKFRFEGIKPVSLNQYYKNNPRGFKIKTGQGLQFDEEMQNALLDLNKDDYKKFIDNFNPETHYIAMDILVCNPNYLIKDNSRLNKSVGDTDNYIKVLKDHVFRYLDIDDYACKEITILEVPFDDNWSINVDLELIPWGCVWNRIEDGRVI